MDSNQHAHDRGAWLTLRQSGVLAHISSLPGRFGIGNMGSDARRFADFLADARFAYWQICPVGPTGYGDSPYQSFSTFAGNPYFIDLTPFRQSGILTEADLEPLRSLPDDHVDYGGLYQRFWKVLEKVATVFLEHETGSGASQKWKDFLEGNHHWLDAYSLFMALKAEHGGRPWYEWDDAYRSFRDLDVNALPEHVVEEAQRQKVYQYLFFTQWHELRAYANSKGVAIIGDLPIFVAHDSADVWQNPEVFRIDADGKLLVSAGVPPDYFSELGQYWGNPLYNWQHLHETGYSWWIERLKGSMALYDVIRLDHFRAFSSFWEIPGDAPDARSGRWVRGPAMKFFDAIYAAVPELKIIAEDLGYIDEAVFRLREAVGLPGMKVLQFGFGHDANNVNLPHYHVANSVVYTGTHDNDTTRGWLSKLDGDMRDQVADYFHCGCRSAWPLIRAALMSVARLAVIPMQDLLDVGSSGRMNTPGTSLGNWQWRFTPQQLDQLTVGRRDELVHLQSLSDRLGRDMQTNYSVSPEGTPEVHDMAH